MSHYVVSDPDVFEYGDAREIESERCLCGKFHMPDGTEVEWEADE